MDIPAIRRKVRRALVGAFTTHVSYYGRNNVRYTRLVKPKPKDFWLSRIGPVYVPVWSMKFQALDEEYSILFFENRTHTIFDVGSDLSECRVCEQETRDTVLLCNDCGKTAHMPGSWRRASHSYFCDTCDKSICRDSAYWRRKWLFMKEVVCSECRERKERTEGVRYEKVPPL
jgi:hypothetical protein